MISRLAVVAFAPGSPADFDPGAVGPGHLRPDGLHHLPGNPGHGAQSPLGGATFRAEHAAQRHGARIPDGEAGGQLALLVRGGCSLHPDAHLRTVVNQAIVAELPKRSRPAARLWR